MIDNCFFSDFFHISNSPLVVRSFFFGFMGSGISVYISAARLRARFCPALNLFPRHISLFAFSFTLSLIPWGAPL